MGIYVPYSDYGSYYHVLTLWGWDPATDQVFVTDNDDSNAGMDTYSFYDVGDQYYLEDYTNSYTPSCTATIDELDALALNSPFTEPTGYSAAAPTTSVIPEPATMTLLGLGLAGLIGRQMHRRNGR
jgi:hypothetical protein